MNFTKTLRVLFSALLLVLCHAASAQGALYFSNYVPAVGLDAPVFDITGQKLDYLSGRLIYAQLLAGADPAHLSAVGAPAGFALSANGYWAATGYSGSLTRVIPGVVPGAEVYLEVQVWSTVTGSTYAEVAAAGGRHGKSAIFTAITGGDTKGDTQPPGFPGYLTNLRSFTLTGVDPVPAVPEPATVSLLALGCLVVLRGRRSRA